MISYFRLTLAFLTLATLTACGDHAQDALPDETLTEEEHIQTEGTGLDQIAGQKAQAIAQEMSEPVFGFSETNQILAKYSYLDPKRIVPSALLKKAVLYFEANKSHIANRKYISVIDFAKNSRRTRFFIISIADGSVWPIHTSHGKGSDSNHDGIATSFGNVSGSGKSSVGFYRTAETYQGKHGYSLRLDGLSETNSKARARAIVIHGADYVKEASVKQGRSLGCPAVSMAIRTKVVDKIKEGSIIYAGRSSI